MGRETVRPYGPRMCDALCKSTEDCLDFIFDVEELSCKLIVCVGCGKAIDKTRSDLDHPACPSVEVDDLLNACVNGRLEVVQKLVCQGMVGVNCEGDDSSTALMVAAAENQLEIFCLLIKEYADFLTVDYSGDNVLHYACTGGSLFIIKTLLDDKRIDVECKNYAGQTPLFNAVYYGNIAAAQLLKDRGADLKVVNNVNETILHFACLGGHIKMVRYVLSLEVVDIESRGKNGRTPLIATVERGELSILKFLHQQEKASLIATDDVGNNVLHMACRSPTLEMVKYLLSLNKLHGFEKFKNNGGMTPIDLAKASGHLKCKMFLESMKYLNQSVKDSLL